MRADDMAKLPGPQWPPDPPEKVVPFKIATGAGP
jgi:hypothetical protein